MELFNTLHQERKAVQSSCTHSWKPRKTGECKIYQCTACYKITQQPITETEE